MDKRNMSVAQAMEQGKSLPFALVRNISHMHLGVTPTEIDMDTLLEARFFSAEEEVRLFRRDGELCVAHLQGQEGDNVMVKTHSCTAPQFGTSITVAHLLETDEDGQTYIADTRLIDWKGRD